MNQNGISFYNVGFEDEYNRPIDTTLLTSVSVYTFGTNTLATIYQDEAGKVAQTNPITSFTNHGVRFFGGATRYDFSVVGPAATAQRLGVQPTDVRMVVPTQAQQYGPGVKIKKIDITSAPTGAEQDTGWDLPAKAVILDVFIDVTAAEATGGTKTLDVGLKSGESGGDANGFLAAISVAATGLIRGKAALTAGANESYFASTTRGALFGTFLAGTNAAGDVGTCYEQPHASTSVTAKSLTYTAGSNDFIEFRGSIYVVYEEIAA